LVKWLSANKMIFTFVLLGAVIFLFVVVPPIKMVGTTSPGMLASAFFDTEVGVAVRLSLYAALIATGVGLVFGVPLAYLLARYEFRGKRVVEAFIDIPIVIPHTAAGIALLFVFGHSFFGGRAFQAIGIDFIDTVAGIVVAMLFVSVPFLIGSAREGFKKVDVRLESVARTLGASPWQTFLRVSLPLAWRSIFSGAIMMWARGISEFGAVVIIAYYPLVAPTLIFERFETRGLTYSQPVAVLLIIITLSIFITVRVLVERRGKS
jgi:molybdate/tungstate transport system permease protein